MNNSVGFVIKKNREHKGLSQEAMALELDITQSSYCRLEKNDNSLTVPKIQKIAKILDVTISYLFDEISPIISNQHNNKNIHVYSMETIINADKEHIRSLKEEIVYLKEEIVYLRKLQKREKSSF